jgi:hypothetical protein
MASVKPLALGLVRHPRHASELVRSRARVSLAAYAHRQSFCLLETFEIDGNPLLDELATARFAAMLARQRPRIVLTHGQLSAQAIRNMALQARLRVQVIAVDAETTSDSSMTMAHSVPLSRR